MSNLQLRSLTIFAPTNEAFQKYSGSAVQVQYHMCKYKYKGLTVRLMFILISLLGDAVSVCVAEAEHK